jgi:lipoprotein-anchoring transpeptidase ErfK/SrfK
MRPFVLCVVTTFAFAVPAYADPLPITPDSYPAMEPTDAATQADANAQAPRYADSGQPNLGGGFIEFLFGGAARQAAAPRDYQQPPAGYQVQPQPQGQVPLAMPEATQPEGTAAEPLQRYSVAAPDDGHPPVDPKYDRQIVGYTGNETPGTIIIDTPDKFLFLVEDGGKALRYGIGVGRPGFAWAGVKTITAKREWPDWRPPVEMLARRPDLPRYMAGGPENPLGARAMYLGSTLYRIHGSNEPWTIGTQVSSGCIRMRNEDVIDLYNRVNVGTKVVVM